VAGWKRRPGAWPSVSACAPSGPRCPPLPVRAVFLRRRGLSVVSCAGCSLMPPRSIFTGAPAHRPCEPRQRALAPVPAPATATATATATPPPQAPRAGHKRPAPAPAPAPEAVAASAREPLLKRRRLRPPQGPRPLDHPPLALHPLSRACPDGQPLSPLFFSSRTTRPRLPARFSSSEAAASMLSNAREDSGIRTVTLARGTFSRQSPPAQASIPSGRTPERSSAAPPTSPDVREHGDALRLLDSVAIVELLEHDPRPTLVIDGDELQHHAPEAPLLPFVFANSALRAIPDLWNAVVGNPPESDPPRHAALANRQFRAWLVGHMAPGETDYESPPPVEHRGIVWTSYTLRKRLRVVSGTLPPHPASSTASLSAQLDVPIPPVSSDASQTAQHSTRASSSDPSHEQDNDYFGASLPTGEPPPALPAPHQLAASTRVSPSDGSGLCPKPSIALPLIEDSTSFANECVLRAQSAGDVDSFHRQPTCQQEERHDMGFFDWTRLAISPSLPRHILFARSVDWASTPLGPIEYWSNDLRAMCNLIMYVVPPGRERHIQ